MTGTEERLKPDDLEPGLEVELYLIAGSAGWDWFRAEVVYAKPYLRVRFHDGSLRTFRKPPRLIRPYVKPAPAAPANAPDTFPVVRDLLVAFCRQLLVLDVEVLEAAIEQGEHALNAAPVLEPLLALKASAELESQLRMMRACLTLRRELEEFRPATPIIQTQDTIQTPGATP